MKKEMICIVCPRGCHLTVEEINGEVKVEGNFCPRGTEHGKQEMTDPKRMLTTTVSITGANIRRIPVISTAEISRTKFNECLSELYKVNLNVPVKRGDIVIKDICGTGVDILAARTIE